MPDLFGWVDSPAHVEAVMAQLATPEFTDAATPIIDSGKGKTALLFLQVRAVRGSDIIRHQTVGDCTGNGGAMAVDVVRAVQKDDLSKITMVEALYAGARIEISGGDFGSGDGATGAAVAQCANKLGTLVYDTYGSLDLREYSGARSRAWGRPGAGIPDELEPIARKHPVKTIARVGSYEEARDAIANGYPVTVASNQGFNSTRDSQGFLRRYGSWPHQMCFIGMDDTGARPGLLCMNSWGPDWVSGPKRLDQPEGSFWVDAAVADRYMIGAGDSWAFSNFTDWRAQPHLILI